MQMKAAVLHRQGLPHPFAQSQPITIEDVKLEGPGEGEVLIEVAAAGLCHSDLSAIEGLRGPRPLPTVIGHEAAGIVRELGQGVKTVAKGDHVVVVFSSGCGNCRECYRSRPNLCLSSRDARATGTLQSGSRRLWFKSEQMHHYSALSTFAQYAVVAEQAIVKIDPTVPLSVAALFGCAVITGVGSVVNTASVPFGASAAVVGLGGVGLSALLGLVACGANPIVAIDLNPEKVALAISLGATHGIIAGAATTASEVRDLTNGGVEFAFEMSGSIAAMNLAAEITERGGTTVTAGLPSPSKLVSYSPSQLVLEEKTLKGSLMGSCVPHRDVPHFIGLYQSGRLPVDRLHDGDIGFEQINASFDDLAAGKINRKTLRPNG